MTNVYNLNLLRSSIFKSSKWRTTLPDNPVILRSFYLGPIHKLLKFLDTFIESVLVSSNAALCAFQSISLLAQKLTLLTELYSLELGPFCAALRVVLALPAQDRKYQKNKPSLDCTKILTLFSFDRFTTNL